MLRNFIRSLVTVRASPNMDVVSKQIDSILESGQNPSDVLESIAVEKARNTDSKLDIRSNSTDLAYIAAFNTMAAWYRRAYLDHIKLPKDRNDPSRDLYLSEIWKEEPIMAGAVYSMQAKMTALRWAVTGRRLKATKFARVLANAAHMGGYSWSGFLASTAQDFYTTGRGVFWETPRPSEFAPISGLGHIDALCCILTGNADIPMRYSSETTGQQLSFHEGEFIHFTSMLSPRERRLGSGFCAVDRALRALHLLLGLHDYDDEKLSNLPPEGVAAITGLTMDEFQTALKLWQAKRQQDKSLTFPQVLWLLGSQPNVEVKVAMTSFSQLPEQFDRRTVVDQYVATVAMCFGVDAREFWPISSGALGTSSETEIQHLKAKGKGPGEFVSETERQINGEADEDTQFGYDTQDIEEDQAAAATAKSWVDVYYPLYSGTPAGKSKASPSGKPNTEMMPNPEEIPEEGAANQAMAAAGPATPAGKGGNVEQVITKDELRRLLADKGVLPEWMMNDERIRVDDTSIHLGKELHPDDFTKIVYEKGILREERLPPIVLNSRSMIVDEEPIQAIEVMPATNAAEVMAWMERLKETVLERNIRGKPIPPKEVDRGAGITVNTVRDELKRWADDPVLSKYLPDDVELETLLAGLR